MQETDKFATLDKIAVFVGNNIDKVAMTNAKKKIAKDYHIKWLIRSSTIKFGILTIVGILSLVDFVINLTGMEIPFGAHSMGVKSSLVLFVSAVLLYLGAKDITGTAKQGVKYLKYFLLPLQYKNPLHLWNPHVGSVSDCQLASYLGSHCNGHTNLYFTGVPYYEIEAISTLTVSFNDSFFRFLLRYAKYLYFFVSYSSKYLAACVEEEFFENKEKKLKITNSVFGVLFASQFFKKNFADELSKLNDSKKINICFDSKFESSDKNFSKRKLLVKTFVEYCLSPDAFAWSVDSKKSISTENTDSKKQISMKIVDSTFLSDKETRHHFAITELLSDLRHKTITIPVKRFVAVPRSAEEDPLLPGVIPVEALKYGIMLGGAEQNLAAQYIFNYYKWHGMGIGAKIGLVENAFENSAINDFSIGTESFVYGITNSITGRITNSSKGIAEVLGICIDGKMFYNIYGYSALITKMATVVFIENHNNSSATAAPTKNSRDESETYHPHESYIPGLAKVTAYHLRYTAPSNQEESFLTSDISNFWDNMDVLNSEQNLVKWLKRFGVEFTLE